MFEENNNHNQEGEESNNEITPQSQLAHTAAIVQKIKEAGATILKEEGLTVTCKYYRANGPTGELHIDTTQMVRSFDKVNIKFGESDKEYTYFIDQLIKKFLIEQEPVKIPEYSDEEKALVIQEAHDMLNAANVKWTNKAGNESVIICKCLRSDYGAESITINLLKDTEDKVMYYYNNSKRLEHTTQ